mmetsp:Transcript_110446/g.293396  ORF Transcript_110446/g.293396 Transcript_110446/m.293396 type:complete len:120 (-) Transcript_110446:142-501(-)
MAPPGAAHPNFTVGGLLAIGGAYAYFKAGSLPSLVGGVGCGALMVGSGLMVEKDPQSAFLLGSATGGLLTAGMLPRFMKTKKVMPAGMVTLLGLGALGYNAMQLSRWWDPESLPFRSKS